MMIPLHPYYRYLVANAPESIPSTAHAIRNPCVFSNLSGCVDGLGLGVGVKVGKANANTITQPSHDQP